MLHRSFTPQDNRAMKLALELADSIKGQTGNNPAVGAVVYKKGRILATGVTQLPGQDHAEKDALKKAGKNAKGATLAVTLEPCCHFGRTPPCTTAIIDAGIHRVIYAVKDPNPKVAGRGARELKKAGLTVETSLFENEARLLNQDFFKYIKTGRPFVALKAATTLNGLVAANSGDSKWITSLESRKFVHELRARYDAILVGMNTVLADDPELTVRHSKGRNPVRIVISSSRDLPLKSKMAQGAKDIRTLLVTAKTIKRARCPFVEYVSLNTHSHTIKIDPLLKCIAKLGIKSLLVEGGTRVFSAFLEQKAVDLFYLFQSPKLLTNGLPLFAGKKSRTMAEALPLTIEAAGRMGDDILLIGHPTSR